MNSALGSPLLSQPQQLDTSLETGISEDPNVVTEQQRVESGGVSPDSAPVLISQLKLTYRAGIGKQIWDAIKSLLGSPQREPKQAVKGVSLAIAPGACFGLLGPNGAGKTSGVRFTMQPIDAEITCDCCDSAVVNVLSGLIVQTEGEAYVGSFNTQEEMTKVHTVLGVCPQFDTVWADLSVQEHLLLFARLKGVSRADERGLVQSVAEAIKLDGDPLQQAASQLSGGMLRRLSLGIALISNPQVVLLDEPSTGLDPETKVLFATPHTHLTGGHRVEGQCGWPPVYLIRSGAGDVNAIAPGLGYY